MARIESRREVTATCSSILPITQPRQWRGRWICRRIIVPDPAMTSRIPCRYGCHSLRIGSKLGRGHRAGERCSLIPSATFHIHDIVCTSLTLPRIGFDARTSEMRSLSVVSSRSMDKRSSTVKTVTQNVTQRKRLHSRNTISSTETAECNLWRHAQLIPPSQIKCEQIDLGLASREDTVGH